MQVHNFQVEDDVLQQLNAMCSIQNDLGDAISGFKDHTKQIKRHNER